MSDLANNPSIGEHDAEKGRLPYFAPVLIDLAVNEETANNPGTAADGGIPGTNAS